MKVSEQCEEIYEQIQEHLKAIRELQEELVNVDLEVLDAEEDDFWNSNQIDEISNQIDDGLYHMNY